MVIDKSLMGNIFSAEVSGEEITDAVNAVQRAYDEYMGPAWKKLQEEGEAGGQMVASRGFSLLVATGAFHLLLLTGTPEEMLEMVKEAVKDTYDQMAQQLKQKRKEQNPDAKA
jgi:hypothetical protein